MRSDEEVYSFKELESDLQIALFTGLRDDLHPQARLHVREGIARRLLMMERCRDVLSRSRHERRKLLITNSLRRFSSVVRFPGRPTR